MKTLNITFSDDVHAILLKLKEIWGLANLNDVIAQAVKKVYEKEAENEPR